MHQALNLGSKVRVLVEVRGQECKLDDRSSIDDVRVRGCVRSSAVDPVEVVLGPICG